MKNSTNRKLLFNNLEEYQDEVERLEEIIKNQSILIQQLSKKEPELRERKLIPIFGGASHIRKTFPSFNSPEYLYYIRNNPVFHNTDIHETDVDEGEGDCDINENGDLILGKGVNRKFFNFPLNLESITGSNDKSVKRPIKELLLMQSKGQTLTKEEKERCIKYAEEIRLKRKKSK